MGKMNYEWHDSWDTEVMHFTVALLDKRYINSFTNKQGNSYNLYIVVYQFQMPSSDFNFENMKVSANV